MTDEKAFDLHNLKVSISGCYVGRLLNQHENDNLELKIDVDKPVNDEHIYSVLDVISGSYSTISPNHGEYFYFRSIGGTVKIEQNDKNKELLIVTCETIVTRNDNFLFDGKFQIELLLNGNVWEGNCKIEIEQEPPFQFHCTRSSDFFRCFTLDIYYIKTMVWPCSTWSGIFDGESRKYKVDPQVAFKNAGIKMSVKKKNKNQFSDPNPEIPWTINEIFDFLSASKEKNDTSDEIITCGMIKQNGSFNHPGFVLDFKDDYNIVLYTNDRFFNGLLDSSDTKNKFLAQRKFLHYLVRECGTALGLKQSFFIKNAYDLSWMTYASKYNDEFGSQKFYENFRFSFSDEELFELRHSPSKKFNEAKPSAVNVSNYGKIRSLPAFSDCDFDNEEDESIRKKLSLKIKLRNVLHYVHESIEMEVRIKNIGKKVELVERDLSLEAGHLVLYMVDPRGNTKLCQSFLRLLNGTSLRDAVSISPNGTHEKRDRYTQPIHVGEGRSGFYFDTPGKYKLVAVYTTRNDSVVSNMEEMEIIDSEAISAQKINVSTLIGGVSHNHSRSLLEAFHLADNLPQNQKKSIVSKSLLAIDEILTGNVRVASSKGNEVNLQNVLLSASDYLEKTAETVEHYHLNGTRDDNIFYKNLVLARTKLFRQQHNESNHREVNQLLTDLISRDVKTFNVQSVLNELKQIESGEPTVNKNSKEFLQKRVEEILEWIPEEKMIENKQEMSGLGLNKPLSQFRNDHLTATSKIVDLLFDKLDEVHDLSVVLDHADNLQQTFQVNHHVLKWAVEIFIVHSDAARKSGIRFPEPKELDSSNGKIPFTELDSASDGFASPELRERTGAPDESWMDYWRSDADVNFHHRHWHVVYIAARIIQKLKQNWCGEWRKEKPYLIREGELFAYMHHQMLARYNAERKSWGLKYTEPWHFNDKDPLGYDAGYEFHHSKEYNMFVPRPPASWPRQKKNMFSGWEYNYKRACDSGFLPSIELAPHKGLESLKMDFNMSGHVLEAASDYWKDEMGSIHNDGHDVFGSNQIDTLGDTSKMSYMGDTKVALRDPIFFRWHQKIDDLWEYWNDKIITPLDSDNPPVLIRSSDIIMRNNIDLLPDFESNFGSDLFVSDVMNTKLGPPLKRFERDFKISHDQFFYHIRFQRRSTKSRKDLNLTFRIFICPEAEKNNRKMWIEMDKFVYKLPSDQNTAVIVRPDKHSSVIKRIPSEMKENNIEKNYVEEVEGFCECGWPYHMLLPKGTKEGEKWCLCVFISDNDTDKIDISSSCGSMSFCGASGHQYPDKKPMGFPFTTDVSIGKKKLTITEAFSKLDNVATSPFVIRNNIATNALPSHVTLWSPWKQLGQNDGTNNPNSPDDTVFRSNDKKTRVRVLVSKMQITLRETSNRVRVTFYGRGSGKGSYSVSNASLSKRKGTSLDIVQGSAVPITVDKRNAFTVSENGVMSDEILIEQIKEDLFVTFTLINSGSSLLANNNWSTNTWVISNPTGDCMTTENWNDIPDVLYCAYISCVGDIVMIAPEK